MVNKLLVRKNQTLEFWKNHLEAFNSSGLTLQDYCLNNNLKKKTFSSWKRRMRLLESNKDKSLTKTDFVQLTTDSLYSSNTINESEIEIIVYDVFRIKLTHYFDSCQLEKLLRVLKSVNKNDN